MIVIKNVRLSYPHVRRYGFRFGTESFRVSFNMQNATAEEYRRFTLPFCVAYICGHNPQRLLTDQRSELRKLIDENRALGEPFAGRELPYMKDILDRYEDEDYSLMQPRKSTFHTGGTITGRWPSREPLMHNMPAIMQRGEQVIPLDYGQLEARVSRAMHVPIHLIEVKVDSGAFLEGVRQAQYMFATLLHETRERMTRATGIWDLLGTPGSVRIDRLRYSLDPRQRKRGWRLHEKHRRAQFARYRKD